MKQDGRVPTRRLKPALYIATVALVCGAVGGDAQSADRAQILSTMKRATTFMVEKVSTNGGFVWNYLPDLSRRWGELEARPTQIWIQPPGTATMGHLFLDAYHATGDEYYYQAADRTVSALVFAQHPSGGWNYLADFGGDRSLREWYDTVGKNAWRMEEFQHHWGNATFDDAGTAESAKLLLRMYIEKRDSKYKAPLDKAIQFVIDSQYPQGFWPQRFPLQYEFSHHGLPDYTSYATFNDDVAGENIDFLIQCYQALGDPRVRDPIARGMSAFLLAQQGPPQPGWGLQYTLDGKPAGARTYEPNSLATHTTATNISLLVRFYRLTGDTRFLARVPEAIDWLEGLKLPPGVATPPDRTHPTFVELGTNRPLYVHREGSNVVSGRYYFDHDSKNTLAHYSGFRRIDVAALRKQYSDAKATPVEQLMRTSPLAPGAGILPLPRFYAVERVDDVAIASVVGSLNTEGYWLAPLGYNSHPFTRDGSPMRAEGDFSQTYVGDVTDTSPYPDPNLRGISTVAFVRNMSALIRGLDGK